MKFRIVSDLVRSFDRLSRIPGSACVLGDFVPYTR
jgi:hypothetical protein